MFVILLILITLLVLPFNNFAAFTNATVARNLNGDTSDCSRVWPELELFVPINVNAAIKRRYEWRDIFMKSLILFWPLELSKTKLLVLVDEENQKSNENIDLQNQLKSYQSYFYSQEIVTKYNNYDPSIYNFKGHDRQQLIMMEADLYSNSAYIGFVDTDCHFITYVDREDLFEEGKPVINARIGRIQNSWWFGVPPSTVWLMGDSNKIKKEPFRCMSYFPVIIKRSHLKDMREYFIKVHNNQSWHEIFKQYSTNSISQFNAMCAYLWYFKRDEYTWYTSFTDNQWPAEIPTVYSSAEAKKEFPAPMWQPKHRIAIHARYHSKSMSTTTNLLESICKSPPFNPKPTVLLEDYCNKQVFNIGNNDNNNNNNNNNNNKRHPHYHPDGYSFEGGNYNLYNPVDVNRVTTERYNRIKSCNHTWHSELLPPSLQPYLH